MRKYFVTSQQNFCLTDCTIPYLHVSLQFPYVSGKSRQGAPVRKIQNTPLINCRVSRALPSPVPFSLIVYGLIFSHALSPISCRCCSLAIFLSSRFFRDDYSTFLLTTLSNTIHCPWRRSCGPQQSFWHFVKKPLCLNCIVFCHEKHRQTNGPQPQKTSIALSWNRQILLFTSAEITMKDV